MTARGRMRRALGVPIVHFLAIGALLFALERVWARLVPAPRATIVVTSEQLARLRRSWTDSRGRAPDSAEERQIIADAVDDEILHREALAAGLDRDDRSVQNRLAQLAAALNLVPDTGPPQLVEDQARSLGFGQSDPVIATHLANMMRLALARTGPSDMPSDEDLQRYLQRNADRFTQPARVRLAHVYFGSDAGEDEVLRVRAELQARGVQPSDAVGRGRAFVLGAEVGPVSQAELARLFGGDLAAAVAAAPLREWTGPLRSAYGLHLVWVHERLAGRIPDLDSVRTRLVHAFLEERAAAKLRARMKAVRARYRVAMTG